jgi:hypothetical protein
MNFTQWRMRHQEFVAVGKPEAGPDARADVTRFLVTSPARPSECYQNAQRLCGQLPHINYVLGRVTIPGHGTIDHAWNSDDYGHFDATLCNRADFDQFIYQALVTISAEEVNAMTWMGMPPTIYEVFMAWQSGQLEAA